MKTWTQRLFPLLLAAGLLAGAVPVRAAESGFTDVSDSDYFAQAVAWAVENGITQGTGGGAFSPENTVTRAEAVTFLWRSAGEPAPDSSASPFTDVTDPNAYYYDAVLWAVEEGITEGVGDGQFALTRTLTYEQIFAFLCRAAGGTATGSNWSSAAINWAKGNGLTEGLTYSAMRPCPRSDVVYCLWKQLGDGGASTGETPEEAPEETQQPEEIPEDVPVGLTDEEGARAAIINALVQREDELDLSSYGLSYTQLSDLMDSILTVPGFDNYYGFSTYWHLRIDTSKPVTVIHLQYLDDAPQILEQNRAVEAEAERVVAQVVTDGMSDYDIAKALHDYLVLNCEYDMRLYSGGMPSTAYTAYGALIDKTAVCSGYARAYEILMQLAGIPVEYVTGDTTRGYHAWNIVQIGGAWYHVDTTWDDPTPDREGYVRYDYFLKSDDYMRRNRHSNWTASHACTSTRYDNADLPDSFEQEEQAQSQEQYNAILDICYAAAQAMPYQTEAALQAATEEELEAARYLYVDFSASGIDVSILSQYRTEAGRDLAERYPDLTMSSFDRDNLRYRLRRDDIAEELQRRQEEHAEQEQEEQEQEEQEEQEQQEQQEQAQEDARVAAIRSELEDILLAGGTGETEVSFPDYTTSEIQQAIREMETDGYSFGGYTYRRPEEESDYSLRLYNGVVTVENLRFQREEFARYEALILEHIRSGETRFTVPYGSYLNEGGHYYANMVANAMRDGGSYDGLTAGVDFVIEAMGGSPDTGLFYINVSYPGQQ